MPIDSTGYDPSIPAMGLDWMDGIGGRLGTPTPDGAVSGAPDQTTDPEEDPNSPELERAEQGTVRHTQSLSWDDAITYANGLGRGTFVTDSFGNQFRILSTLIHRKVPGNAEFTTVAESISFDTPPDEFDVQTIELNPAIEKHPRYAFLTASTRADVNNAVQAATVANQNSFINGAILSIPHDTDPLASAPFPNGVGTNQQNYDAAVELLSKRRVGEDTFYLPGFRVVWVQYYYYPPLMHPGGVIQDPMAAGGLPAYFWSQDGTPAGKTIFSDFIALAPQFYQTDISWLRLVDDIHYERTWFRITRSWLGAPYSHWDADLYTNQPSPYPPPPKFVLSGIT